MDLIDNKIKYEKYIAETLLFSGKDIVKTMDLINSDSFSNKDCRNIYNLAVRSLTEKLDVATEFRASGGKTSDLLQGGLIPDIENLSRSLKRVNKTIKFHGIIDNVKLQATESNIDEILSNVSGQVTELYDNNKTDPSVITALEEFDALQGEYAEKRQQGETLLGYTTGFSRFDQLTDGFRKGHLWVIGGYTSAGKTFLTLNFVATALKKGKKVLFYSLEMSHVDIVGRLIGILSGVNSIKILKGSLTQIEKEKVDKAREFLKESKLFIYNNFNCPHEIILESVRQNIKEKTELVVIDYLQMLTSAGQNAFETLETASKTLQGFAIKQDLTVVALSQVTNEGAKNNTGIINFKGSGAIAASADVAIELKAKGSEEEINDNKKNNIPIEVDAQIKKNRHGMTGKIPLELETTCGRFRLRDTTFD